MIFSAFTNKSDFYGGGGDGGGRGGGSWYLMHTMVLSLVSIFLNSKTSIVTDLKPFNSDNNSISLFLVADSVFLSCSSGLKEFKISTL